jgi:hypothetical protein
LPFLRFDYSNKADNLIAIVTSIAIDVPVQAVWGNVIRFDTIPELDSWIFKTGIAYPKNAIINGTSVGAIRKCNFRPEVLLRS